MLEQLRERGINDFATATQVETAVNTFQCS